MTPLEYAKLLEYIKENNSWGLKMEELLRVRHRRVVKYVESSFDTRDGRVWRIKFLSCIGSDKSENIFRISSPADVKKIYDWLDDEGFD